jgi:hypothetical protein
MKVRALTKVVLVAVSVTLVAACSRERIDWKSAEAADTQEAYSHFLERHPDSALATQARTRLAQLAEDKDWQRASAADTADAYKQFLAQHPSGKWAEEARIRIENFSLDANPSPLTAGDATSDAPIAAGSQAPMSLPAASGSADPAMPARAGESAAPAALPPRPSIKPAPASVTAQATTEAASSTVKSATAPKPAATPSPPKQTVTTGPASKPVTTASSEGYGIQLGAFSTQAAALSAWKQLQTTHATELHGLFAHAVPVQVSSGKLYRLQSPVGDEGRARSICASLSKQQTPCVVVLPAEKR